MKNIAFTLLALFLSGTMLFSQSDATTSLFKDYTEDEQFTSVYIGPQMFQMIADIDNDESAKEIAEISKDIKSLRILMTEKDAMSIYKSVNAKLNADKFEELMSYKEKGSDVRFVTKSKNGKIYELIMTQGSDTNFSMLNFTGDISLKKLAKLADRLDIQGSDQLKKLAK